MTFEIIKATFDELGNKYFYQVSNAKDYGIPQHRERLFIIGFKDTHKLMVILQYVKKQINSLIGTVILFLKRKKIKNLMNLFSRLMELKKNIIYQIR